MSSTNGCGSNDHQEPASEKQQQNKTDLGESDLTAVVRNQGIELVARGDQLRLRRVLLQISQQTGAGRQEIGWFSRDLAQRSEESIRTCSMIFWMSVSAV
jgi:hypothetical protein